MAGPRVSALARWTWRSPSLAARLARAALLPAAGLFRAAVAARNAAYGSGLLRVRALGAPSIGVGNLSVGGTGKTPVAIHLARALAERGVRAGIVLRGYGGDEVLEYMAAAPRAVVEASPDRHAAAARALAAGARALVLDDCLQRRDVAPDVMLAVVSAETWAAVRWPLPAGPWREGLSALARTDAVVVTRKVAAGDAAERLAASLAGHTRGGAGITVELALGSLEPLGGGAPIVPADLAGRAVTALCGVGEPELFAAQLTRAGAVTQLAAFPDHHAWTRNQALALARTARLAGRVVVTTVKDAVKLLDLWPSDEAPCYVAALVVRVTSGAAALESLLDRVATAARTEPEWAAAASSARET